MYKKQAQFKAERAGLDLNEVKGGERTATGLATTAQSIIVSGLV
jgi:hypothetical protein